MSRNGRLAADFSKRVASDLKARRHTYAGERALAYAIRLA